MRWLALAATLPFLPGCLFLTGDGPPAASCWDAERAQTWRQDEYWDWQPDASGGMVVVRGSHDAELPPLDWPEVPFTLLGKNGVRSVDRTVREGFDVTFMAVPKTGAHGPPIGLEVSALLPPGTPAAERDAVLRAAIEAATDAQPEQVAHAIAGLAAQDDGGDASGTWLLGLVPDARLDLEGLHEVAGWTARPERAGHWRVDGTGWSLKVDVDWRVYFEPGSAARSVEVDAGGFVRGPRVPVDSGLGALRNQTVDFVHAWGMPEPTFEALSTQALQVCT